VMTEWGRLVACSGLAGRHRVYDAAMHPA
jgi:hypothetical protein